MENYDEKFLEEAGKIEKERNVCFACATAILHLEKHASHEQEFINDIPILCKHNMHDYVREVAFESIKASNNITHLEK